MSAIILTRDTITQSIFTELPFTGCLRPVRMENIVPQKRWGANPKIQVLLFLFPAKYIYQKSSSPKFNSEMWALFIFGAENCHQYATLMYKNNTKCYFYCLLHNSLSRFYFSILMNKNGKYSKSEFCRHLFNKIQQGDLHTHNDIISEIIYTYTMRQVY